MVKACVEFGAHHIDISGEPYFLEKMQLDYHDAAMKKGGCHYIDKLYILGLEF